MKLPSRGHSRNSFPKISPTERHQIPALDLASRRIAQRWGLPARRAELLAELAGLGGQP